MQNNMAVIRPFLKGQIVLHTFDSIIFIEDIKTVLDLASVELEFKTT